MGLRWMALSMFLVLVAQPVAANEAQRHCAAWWPGDYSMQVHCVEQQARAGEAIYDYLSRYGMTLETKSEHSSRGEVPALILDKCADRWHPDLMLMAQCLKMEEAAATALGKIGGAAEDGYEFEPGVNGTVAGIAAVMDYLKRHAFDNVGAAAAAAARGEPAGVIFVECKSEDFPVQARCLVRREAAELKAPAR